MLECLGAVKIPGRHAGSGRNGFNKPLLGSQQRRTEQSERAVAFRQIGQRGFQDRGETFAHFGGYIGAIKIIIRKQTFRRAASAKTERGLDRIKQFLTADCAGDHGLDAVRGDQHQLRFVFRQFPEHDAITTVIAHRRPHRTDVRHRGGENTIGSNPPVGAYLIKQRQHRFHRSDPKQPAGVAMRGDRLAVGGQAISQREVTSETVRQSRGKSLHLLGRTEAGRLFGVRSMPESSERIDRRAIHVKFLFRSSGDQWRERAFDGIRVDE